MPFSTSVRAAALVMLALVSLPGDAAYPDRPIKLIAPAAAGTLPDLLARLVGERLGAALGQPVVVETRPGAIGTIGLAAVAKAPPNGYTLGVLNVPYVVAPSLIAQIPYDTARDLTAVTLMAWNYSVLAVSFGSAAGSLADLVGIAKAKPGALKYSSAGNATPPHLAGELFKRAAGIELQHIPYKGGVAAITALLSGDVDMYFASPATVARLVGSAKLRVLATSAPRRLPAMPDVPTLTELGYPVDISDWQGIVAPAGTPPEAVVRLHTEIAAILAEPVTRARLDAMGVEASGLGPEQFARHITSEIARWGKLVRDAGIKPD